MGLFNKNENAEASVEAMRELRDAIRNARNELTGFNNDLSASYAAIQQITNLINNQTEITAQLVATLRETLKLKQEELEIERTAYEQKSKADLDSTAGRRQKANIDEQSAWLKLQDLVTQTLAGAMNDAGKVDFKKIVPSLGSAIRGSVGLDMPGKTIPGEDAEGGTDSQLIISGQESKSSKVSNLNFSSMKSDLSKIRTSLGNIEKELIKDAPGKHDTNKDAEDGAAGAKKAGFLGKAKLFGKSAAAKISGLFGEGGEDSSGVEDTPETEADTGGADGHGGDGRALDGAALLAAQSGNLYMAAIIKVVQGVANMLGKLTAAVEEEIDYTIDLLESDETRKFDSRLYGILSDLNGTNANFIAMTDKALENLTNPENMPFIDIKEYLTNMTNLVNQGIAYNVEQRAMWETMMSRIVSTFETTNETLLRLIQLLQQELTDTYMGVEAAITRTLNSMFTDTQYLNSTYDTVWSALTDALANVDTDLGTAIAYQVQLWLGSLSSLGLSSNAASSIAEQINYLLIGDSEKLGETGTRLMAMAAADAGISFADLLVNGVQSGEDMSKFMNSIITVLLNIQSASEGNNVLLSEWGKLLNLSIADWKAISNLSANAIETLAAQSGYSLADAKAETEYIEKNLVGERTFIASRVSTAIHNMMFEGGWNIASNTPTLIAWKTIGAILSLLTTFTGEGGILGTLVNLAADVTKFPIILGAYFTPLFSLMASLPSLITGKGYKQFSEVDTSNNALARLIFQEALGEGAYVGFDSITSGSYTSSPTSTGYMSIERALSGVTAAMQSTQLLSATEEVSPLGEDEEEETVVNGNATPWDDPNYESGMNNDYSGQAAYGSKYSYPSESSGETVSNASDESVIRTSTHTIDDIYAVLTYGNLSGMYGIPVRVVSVDDEVSLSVTSTNAGGVLGISDGINYVIRGENTY